MGIAPETIPFFYDEYLAKGRRPSASVLKDALAQILAGFHNIRLLVDGIDELPESEHKPLINELIHLTEASNYRPCKLLISGQDLPHIRQLLSKKQKKSTLFLGDARGAIEKDVGVIVTSPLRDLDENIGIAIGPPVIEELQNKILQKSEGEVISTSLLSLS